MTPEEHQRAGDLFGQLRDLPYSSQIEALRLASEEDPDLYLRVSKLLDADRRASSNLFLERHALEDAAELLRPEPTALPPMGTQIGNYRLGKKIGAGGMGVVYEAEDLRLPRKVAIKLLPSEAFASEHSKERIQRFEREARAASLLNHPHIVSILDASFDRGFYYIAMEFVDGRTLRELIEEEAPNLERSTMVELLSQVASAMGAAHHAGVVHRDIKPENIMVRPDGFVKVLDFGLATVRESGSDPKDLRTRTGHLAGTIQYLSPEQVLGKPATPRSDLFCLGVVAYEVATGRRPFDGPSDGFILDAILNHAPVPPSSIRPGIDHELEQMILQLLEKDPELRFQTAADLRSCCKRLARTSSQRSVPAYIRQKAKRSSIGRVTLAAAAGLVWGSAVVWLMEAQRHISSTPLPVHFAQLTNGQGEKNSPSLNPDGKQFVYASSKGGNWDIFLQRTGGRESVNLTKDSVQDDTQPSFSPDGSHIAFRSERDGGGLFVMESTGENPRRLTTQGYMPSWSPDNRRLVFATHTFSVPGEAPDPPSHLYLVNLDDSSTHPLKTGDALQPSWSPHGDRIAYWGLSAGGRRDIFTIAPDRNERPLAVTADDYLDWNPVWAPSGRQLYFLSDRGGSKNVWRVDIEEKTGRTSGNPEPVTVPARSVGSIAIAGDGKTFIYGDSSQRATLRRIAFDPAERKVSGSSESIGESQIVFDFDFSPDGSRIVYCTVGDTSENLWIMNADGTNRRMLTSDSYRNRGPQWSPRGDEILFYSDRAGHYDEWTIHPDGSGLRALTTSPTLHMQNGAWSPDGKKILAGRFGAGLLLDPTTRADALQIEKAAVTLPVSNLFCNSWTQGPDGSLAACDLGRPAGGFEAVVFAPATNALEHTGLSGLSTCWASASHPAEAHRALIFADGSKCMLYDRWLKRKSELFSVAPHTIRTVAATRDGKLIYFTQRVREGDLWIASLTDSAPKSESRH
jgi:Tol biopolymer transport system component/tRNA A-37 threonylcarbamoyl transferase component Bud32